MESRFAKIISSIFHPLLMPTYGFLLIFSTVYTIPALAFKLSILIVTFVFTFMLPTINALILLKAGRINSLEMETTNERIIPYVTTSLYFFALVYLFVSRDYPLLFSLVIAGAGLSILISFFINFFWKISAHAIGIGGIIGALMGITYQLGIATGIFLIAAIFIAGLIGYSRLKLNAHVPSQVYTGFLLGFVVEFTLILLFLHQ